MMMNHFLTIFVSLLVASSLQAGKPRVAISEFTADDDTSRIFAEIIMTNLEGTLVKTKEVTVIEREELSQILKEHKMQLTGITDQNTAVSVGKILNVSKMILGRVTHIKSLYTYKIKMVDVETAEIVYYWNVMVDVEKKDEMDAFGVSLNSVFPDLYAEILKDSQIKTPQKQKTVVTHPEVPLGKGEIRNEKDGSILIEIPAGTFIMGGDKNMDEKPIHTVNIDTYYIGKYEITVSQFIRFCAAIGKTMPKQPEWSNLDDNPVVNITWFDARDYCEWAGLRLPTEAEWEKAARGNDGRSYPWGNDWNSINCNSIENGDKYKFVSPVGAFPSGRSPYGVYDMAGNVWEWCNDWYGEKYYRSSPPNNPKGPSSGATIPLRGGCWDSKVDECRSAYRAIKNPKYFLAKCGFRVAK